MLQWIYRSKKKRKTSAIKQDNQRTAFVIAMFPLLEC